MTDHLKETPSQTAGPYVHIGLMPQMCGVTRPAQLGHVPMTDGERIRVTGTVWDGDGEPVKDVLIEVWQADAQGNFPDTGHTNWHRIASDFDTGTWALDTIRPGAIGGNAPHLSLWIVARGINIGLHSRLYFEGGANMDDPILMALTPDQRKTLIATKHPEIPSHYAFDIHLQGDKETVFFDV